MEDEEFKKMLKRVKEREKMVGKIVSISFKSDFSEVFTNEVTGKVSKNTEDLYYLELTEDGFNSFSIKKKDVISITEIK